MTDKDQEVLFSPNGNGGLPGRLGAFDDFNPVQDRPAAASTALVILPMLDLLAIGEADRWRAFIPRLGHVMAGAFSDFLPKDRVLPGSRTFPGAGGADHL